MTVIEQLRAEIAEEVIEAIEVASIKWASPPYERDRRTIGLAKERHVMNVIEEVAPQFGVDR